MSVITYFTIPAEDFVFGGALESQPNVSLRLETMVPTGSTLIPYCWIEGADVDDIEAGLEASPFIEDVRLLDELDEEALFRIEWGEGFDGLVDAIRESEAVILEGVGSGGQWSFRFRFADYEALSTFYRACADNDIRLTLDKVHNPVEPRDMARYGLTTQQRQALVTALESGYFDVPRRTTLVELGERLGVSDAAVSQRLRRGLNELVSATLTVQPERERFEED